jgi:tetratricopeptide (TPR) repeat protein
MKKLFSPIFYFVIFVVSVGLVGYSWLILQTQTAQRAYEQGDFEAATRIYEQAEKPFYFVPWLSRILREEYKNVSLRQVAILYEQNQTDEAFEKLEQISIAAPSLTESGEYSFWTGNLLFRRALQTKDPETAVNAAKAALSEYQKGLAAQPDDWDLKYNFELVSQIFQKGDKSKDEQKVKSLVDKMRQNNEPSREELAPEKRG